MSDFIHLIIELVGRSLFVADTQKAPRKLILGLFAVRDFRREASAISLLI